MVAMSAAWVRNAPGSSRSASHPARRKGFIGMAGLNPWRRPAARSADGGMLRNAALHFGVWRPTSAFRARLKKRGPHFFRRMSDVHVYKPASRDLPVPIGMNIAHWFTLNLFGLIVKSGCQWDCAGSENIPMEGGIIIAMNHQSFIDPPLVALASPRQDIVYLAKAEIMEWPLIGRLFPDLHVIPVDQQNADRTALRHLINIVRT